VHVRVRRDEVVGALVRYRERQLLGGHPRSVAAPLPDRQRLFTGVTLRAPQGDLSPAKWPLCRT
jgi:hypothetical protein